MITREEDIDAHALYRQGWTISAIARHLSGTAGRSARTCAMTVSPGFGPGRPPTRSGRSPRTARPG